ncbi:dihydrolipoyl dehydrogenase [Blattabacterium cuenoti]|uniref:dihydrolipoyl dehydrogenase n=1 Tax=Blattabacterium cuenoti TaxID=1653831 RepID=UPI00163CE5D3|nr:dihydrolipoyl dehydrogenase [Blattabacterium cuenoti]
MNNFYDLVVIGSGPGGYISAIRASQLGLRTAIIEKYKDLGGTCLNIGCIPSKTLLYSSKYFFLAKNYYSSHGIFFENLSLDFIKMMERKNNIIKRINNGIKYLMKKNHIDLYNGLASFKKKKGIISITDENFLKEKKEVLYKNCIIATGSKPLSYPSQNFNHKKKIISSTEALSLDKIPKKLIVIGGGVIGLELSSLFHQLGSHVTIIESMDRIIFNMDNSLSIEMKKIFKKYSIQIETSSIVKKIITLENNEVLVLIENKNNGKETKYVGDFCLISIGRIPYTKNLGLDNLGIKTDKKGFITVNDSLQTSEENIYAVGDVIGGKMLAHKAEEEGLYVAELLAGKKPNKPNYNLIPSVIYTYPEVSSVGDTEEEVKEKKIEYNKGIFPNKILGIALANGNTDGFVKILSNKKTDEILGVHMIGSHVSDMIMEATIAMEFRASSEDIYRICHPHPTYSEAFKESALLNFEGQSIHM